MQPEGKIKLNTNFQKISLVFLIFLIIILIFVFKNIFFKSTLMLRNLGNVSMDPEIAFNNKKPTLVEYYAEWCEVCKEMAPKISEIRQEYENQVNFVFLNVDNPQWNNYINKFNVNGIPHLNLFDANANLKLTWVGLQDENIIKDSLSNLLKNDIDNKDYSKLDFSDIKRNSNIKVNPRSHG